MYRIIFTSYLLIFFLHSTCYENREPRQNYTYYKKAPRSYIILFYQETGMCPDGTEIKGYFCGVRECNMFGLIVLFSLQKFIKILHRKYLFSEKR